MLKTEAVPREMLKTEAVGLGFQHLRRDLANVNAWKTMFDRYIKSHSKESYDKQNLTLTVVITDELLWPVGKRQQ